MVNGGDLNQIHTSLGGLGSGMGGMGGSGGGQDAAAKHKQLSELLRAGAPPQQGAPSNGGAGASMALMGGMNATAGGPQGLGPQGGQAGLMQQQQQAALAGGVSGMNRAAMMNAHKANGQQQHQGLMGGQMMNGSPRMGYPGGNLLAETLQGQSGGQQMGPGGPTGIRAQQPGALNKVRPSGSSPTPGVWSERWRGCNVENYVLHPKNVNLH